MSCSIRLFRRTRFERERAIQLDLIRAQRDHLLQCCNQAMRRGLFGHAGYGLDPLGTESSVAALRRADVAGFYQRLAVPNNCVLAIFGDVRAADIKPAVQRAFGRWKKGAAVRSAEPPPRR